jgi:hypothetical protein
MGAHPHHDSASSQTTVLEKRRRPKRMQYANNLARNDAEVTPENRNFTVTAAAAGEVAGLV